MPSHARLRFPAFGHDAEMEIALQRAWGRQDSGVQETGPRQRETDANERLRFSKGSQRYYRICSHGGVEQRARRGRQAWARGVRQHVQIIIRFYRVSAQKFFGIERSLSRKGCPYDNAVMESRNKTLMVTLVSAGLRRALPAQAQSGQVGVELRQREGALDAGLHELGGV